jgi:hypothetical protein
VSLKEALDAAHGHEHATDGSELTPAKKAAMDAPKKPGTTTDGGHKRWMFISGGLFVLLLASLFRKNRAAIEPNAR